MIDVLNVFSTAEKDAMNLYVRHCASTEESEYRKRIDFCDVLAQSWAIHKEPLYNLFGQKMILEKEVEYLTPKCEIESAISDSCANGVMQEFYKAVYERWYMLPFHSPEYKNYSSIIHYVLSCSTLAENSISTGFTLCDPKNEEKTYVYQYGTKPMKAISKFAELYNIPGFENFRLEHSRILNKKKFKGTLCLSIHPFDYMTMSDNTYDWSSCMSWWSTGCYRRGTVEMMNSPYAIVAYLKGDREFYPVNDFQWNNKKWRTLILATPDILTSIKSYPYSSNELTEEAVKWVAELVTAAKPNYYDINNMTWLDYCGGFREHKSGELVYNISMTTGAMYNDFGCAPGRGHCCIVAENYLDRGKPYSIIYYSGDTQCVWCGGIQGMSFDNEEFLICFDCGGNDHQIYCPWCEEAVDEDDVYYIDGETMCQYCYENHAVETVLPWAGEYHLDSNCTEIKLVAPDSTRRYNSESIMVYATEDHELDDLKEKYLPHLYYHETWRRWCVNPLEATDNELEYFGICRDELQGYLDDIK